jgi:quercetin dioxygenase-like cupin family protein
VERWHLPTIAPSSDKALERQPGPNAPRVPTPGRSKPRVLFSEPECRAVVIDLLEGDKIDDHAVRERAVIEVVAGRIVLTVPDESAECETGTLISLEPGERRHVQALADTRLLLMLTPWPAADRDGDDVKDARHLPRNATVPPVELQEQD